MGTIQETGVKFTMQVDEMFKKFGLLEKSFDNLPLAAEKATNKLNNAFEESITSIKTFDDLLSKSGKDFDTKVLQSELQKAQKEFTETGKVNKDTMQSLQKEIKNVDWKSLDLNSRQTFKNVISNVNSVERNMKKLEDVKFLEGLPEDARNAGKQLIALESDINKVSKSMKSMDDGADFSKLNKGLQTAKNELKETGKISDSVMTSINNDIKNVDFDVLPVSASVAMGKVEQRAEQLDKELKSLGDNVDVSGATKGLSKGIEDSTGAVGGLKGAFKTLGPVIGGALATVSVVDFTKKVIESTAEVKALNSQYEQVMGDMKGTTDKYLGEISKKYNVHPNELKKSMLQYHAILKSKGLSEKDAYETSKLWLERTVDGSSFANESMEESTARMMGIIKGEYDSADTVMINLSQTMLNDLAVEKYGKKWEKLTVQQQENLKVQESIRQHNKAGVMGQGIKEADSYEKNLARLKNTWTDFLATYGGPALSAANQGLKGTVKILQGFGSLIDKASGNVTKLKNALTGLFTGDKEKGRDLLSKLGFSQNQIKAIESFADKLTGARDKISNVIKGFKDVFSGKQISGYNFLASAGLSQDSISKIQTFADKFNDIKNRIKGTFDAFKNMFTSDGIEGVMILTKLGFTNDQINLINDVINRIKLIGPAVSGGIQTATKYVKAFWDMLFGDGFKGIDILTKMGLSTEQIVKINNVIEVIKKPFFILKDTIGLVVREVGKFLGTELKKHFGFLLTEAPSTLRAFGNIAKFAMGVVVGAFKIVFPVIKTLGTIIGTVMMGVWKVMQFVWPAVKYLIVSVWNNIKGVISGGLQVIRGLMKVFTGLFTGDWKKMWSGIKDVFFGAIKFLWNYVQLMFYGKLLKGALGFAKLFAGGLKSMWGQIVSFFKSFGATLWKNTTGIFSKIASGISKIFGNVVKWLINSAKGLDNKLVAVFKSIWNGLVKIFTALKNGLLKSWTAIKKTAVDSAKYIFDKVTGFFKSLWTNSVKFINNLKNGMFNSWKSIKQNAYDAGKYVKDKVVGFIKDTWTGVQKWIGSIKSGFTNLKDDVISKVKSMANGMSEKVTVGLNVMIDGVNWVADKLGMDKLLNRIDPKKYSTGTGGGHPGGLATVADKGPGNGKGVRELVQFPNGRTALFEKETTFNMPPGTHVLSNKQTEPILEAMKYSTGTPGAGGKKGNFITNAMGKIAGKAASNYIENRGADNAIKDIKTTAKVGETVQDVYEYASNPGKLLDLALKKFGLDLGAVKGITGDLFKKGFGKLKGGAVDLITKWFEETSGGDVDGGEILSFPLTTIYSPNKRPPGYPFNANHYGIDLATPAGTTLHAPTSGTVSQQSDFNGGLIARLVSGNVAQYFLHLQKVLKTGQVKQGDAIVKTGNSGHMTTGAHLHYQVEEGPSSALSNRNTLNPIAFLKKHGGSIASGVQGAGSWANKIRQAAKQMKVSITDSQVNGLLAQMQRESGFRETVTQGNIGDINNLLGTPAKGLLQYVPSTFNAYKVPGYNNILNGYHQLLAFFNNSNWKNDLMYGKSGWGPRGTRRFANGGFTKGESYIAGEEYEEAIIPMDPKRKARANQLLQQANYKVNGPLKYSVGTQKSHKVKWGDTLWDIANKNKTTVKFLQALNNIKNHLIYPGQIIKLTDSIKHLNGNVKKSAVNKKSKSTKQSRTQVVLELGKSLLAQGKSNTKSRTSKDSISIGNLIASRLKDVGIQNVDGLYADVTAINKKINAVIKSSTSKVKSLQSKLNNLVGKKKKTKANWKSIANARKELHEFQMQINTLKKLKATEVLKSDFIKKMYGQREALLKKYATLQEKEKAIKDEKSQFKSSLNDNLQSFAGFGASKGNTARDFVAFMKYRLGRVRKFSANMTKLKQMGLDPEIMKEMLAGGIESAMPRAEVLIAGGKGYIKKINALQDEVNKALGLVSSKQANNVFLSEQKEIVRKKNANTNQRKALNSKSRSYMTQKTVSKHVPLAPKKATSKQSASKNHKVTNHNIKWGETLGGIAAKYHTSVSAIKKLNGLKNDMIYAGRKLKIPGYAKGGIIDIPQIAWIAEGGFAESIISHDPSQRVQQHKIWKDTGDKLGFNKDDALTLRMIALLQEQNELQRITAEKRTVLQLDKKVIAKEIAPEIDKEMAQNLKYRNRGLANV